MKFLILLNLVIILSFSRSYSMEFRAVHNGGMNADNYWIAAEGKIEKDTPQKFLEFLKLESNWEYKVVLNSDGGDLFAGMELGRIFREYKFHTGVGSFSKPTDNLENYHEDWEILNKGKCLSSCAYAFLGGINRSVTSWGLGHKLSKIGFHQFYSILTKEERALEILEEKTHFSEDQLVSAFILFYLTEMGIDPNVMTLAAFASSSDMIYPNAEVRKELKIDYEPDGSFTQLELQAYKNGLIAFAKPVYENRLNLLEQVSFFCKESDKLKILLTRPIWTNTKDEVMYISPYYLGLNFDEGRLVDYDKSIKIEPDRILERHSTKKHYITISLNNHETYKILNSNSIYLYLMAARVAGRTFALIELNSVDRQGLALTLKNCI